jgi:hypothetical protein
VLSHNLIQYIFLGVILILQSSQNVFFFLGLVNLHSSEIIPVVVVGCDI